MTRNPDIRAIFDLVNAHLKPETPEDLTLTVGRILAEFYESSSYKELIDNLPLPLIDALEPHFANLIQDLHDLAPDLNA